MHTSRALELERAASSAERGAEGATARTLERLTRLLATLAESRASPTPPPNPSSAASSSSLSSELRVERFSRAGPVSEDRAAAAAAPVEAVAEGFLVGVEVEAEVTGVVAVAAAAYERATGVACDWTAAVAEAVERVGVVGTRCGCGCGCAEAGVTLPPKRPSRTAYISSGGQLEAARAENTERAATRRFGSASPNRTRVSHN